LPVLDSLRVRVYAVDDRVASISTSMRCRLKRLSPGELLPLRAIGKRQIHNQPTDSEASQQADQHCIRIGSLALLLAYLGKNRRRVTSIHTSKGFLDDNQNKELRKWNDTSVRPLACRGRNERKKTARGYSAGTPANRLSQANDQEVLCVQIGDRNQHYHQT
jgi:hypothetical protein